MAPYYEDDMALLKDLLGVERLLFGSDFPHTEGLPSPTMFVKDILTFTPAETRRVMRDNVLDLPGMSIAIGEDKQALAAAARRPWLTAARPPWPGPPWRPRPRVPQGSGASWPASAGSGWPWPRPTAARATATRSWRSWSRSWVAPWHPGRCCPPRAAALALPEARPDLAAGRRVGAVALGGSICAPRG